MLTPLPSMSARERILAAMERKPVDRLPYVPLIDVYTVLDMPPRIQEVYQEASIAGYWQGMLAVTRAIGVDVMLRHVDVTAPFAQSPHIGGFGLFDRPVELSSRMEGSTLIEVVETPVGTLTGTWGFTDRHGWIPHPIHHLVNDYEELKIFHYAVEHLSPEPPPADYENFLAAQEEVGEEGIATTSLLNTPLMHLIETAWGLESTYYLLHDYREMVEDILHCLHKAQLLTVQRIAESPARVVIEYENTSSTLLSPGIFRRYCLPYLNEHACILREAGKIFLVHMCGKLRVFLDDLATGEFSGIADISPPPTGDRGLDEMAACLPGKVLVGGIDATTYIKTDLADVEETVAGLIERLKPFPGVLLGSADTAPRGTPVETFQLVKHLVETVGSYGGGQTAYVPGGFRATMAAQAGEPEVAQVGAAGEAAGMYPVLQELTRRLDGKRPDVTATIKFDVTDDAVYRLIITEGRCRLERGDGPFDAAMIAASKHLLAIFTGKLNPTAAFMTRKLKIDGSMKLLGVLPAAQG